MILTALKDYILEYLPKIKNEVRNNVNWLTDVYYHDIASSVITNGWVNDCEIFRRDSWTSSTLFLGFIRIIFFIGWSTFQGKTFYFLMEKQFWKNLINAWKMHKIFSILIKCWIKIIFISMKRLEFLKFADPWCLILSF